MFIWTQINAIFLLQAVNPFISNHSTAPCEVPFLVFLRRRPSTIILEAPLENPVVLNPSRGKSDRRKRYNMLMS